MEQQLDFDEKEQAFVLMCSLDAMRKEKKECDLVIKVGNQELPVHRNVMRARSDYIDKMLSHDTLENQSGVVEMKGVRFEPVKKCVDFFYTGKISTSDEKCEELLYTADLMLIKPVCDRIATFLQSHLNPKSFFNIKKIATKFVLENLKKACEKFALEKLDLIVKEEEFNLLEMEYVSQLLTSKVCLSNGENFRLAIILQWVKADVENRQMHLIQMMRILDLKNVTPSYARHLVETESLLSSSSEIMSMLFIAMMDKQSIKAAPAPTSFSSDFQPNSIVVFDISSNAIQVYQPAKHHWKRMHSLHPDMQGGTYFAAVFYEKQIFVLLPNNKMYKTDFSDNNASWVRMKDMLDQNGTQLNAVVHSDFIYVSGKNSMEKYCLVKNEWEKVDCDAVVCDECTLFAHNDFIYCIGGNKKGALKQFLQFSPEFSTWSTLKPMHGPRRTPAVTAFNDKIYVAGGFGYIGSIGSVISDVEFYEVETSTWSRMKPMKIARSLFGLFAVDNKLYAVGHYQNECTIEAYDLHDEKWEEVLQKTNMKIVAKASLATCLE